jgi:hydrogenase/urease accessory protein HupE
MRNLTAIIFVVCAALLPRVAIAHEMRPAYIEITQTDATQYTIVWKQPTQGEMALRLIPHLSNGWLEQTPSDQYAAGGFLIRTWHITASSPADINHVTLEIEGLADTFTDTFVNVRLLSGEHIKSIVKPEQPNFEIAFDTAQPLTVPAYLLLGIEHILRHILSGPDHLLFVLGLLLIVRARRRLLMTVSAFTLAHSITLAATVLGKIVLPVPFVEMMIALSILFLGPEVIRAQRGGKSLMTRYPWLVAFAFGLFHGMGFASGLSTLGFNANELFSALVMFNIGVEIGQLCFIGFVFAVVALIRKFDIQRFRYITALPAYVVGIGGAYWSVQCATQWLGIS